MKSEGRAWIELDMKNLEHNVETLSSILPTGCELMPAIKANAYGHGAVPIAQKLNNLGIRAFCVATLEEGIELRRAGIEGEILVLGYTHPDYLYKLSEFDLTQTVIDYPYANKLNNSGFGLNAHLAIDSGMHRIGVMADNIAEIEKILNMENLNVTGIFTHLCTDDGQSERDNAFTECQAKRFFDAINQIGNPASRLKKHILGSYGLLNYPWLGGDYARVGIALYGVLSSASDFGSKKADIFEVLSLKARVTTLRKLKSGESAGYGLDFTANSNTTLASLSIGYADGLPRALSCGRGMALINGKRFPIAGRICMDQTLIDIGGDKTVTEGDIAVIIGSSDCEHISAYDLATEAKTITNEILSRLGSRLERIVVG